MSNSRLFRIGRLAAMLNTQPRLVVCHLIAVGRIDPSNERYALKQVRAGWQSKQDE